MLPTMTTVETGVNPTPVRISFACWIIITVVGIVGGVLLAAGAGSAVFAGIDEEDGRSTAVLAITGALVLVFGLIQLWLAFKMRAGHNWARITLAVLGVLSLISMWGGSGGGIYNWVYLILLVIGVAAMFAPANAAWFRARA